MTYWVVESFPNQGSDSVPSVVGAVKVPLSKILNTYLLQGQYHLADPGAGLQAIYKKCVLGFRQQ